MKKHLSILMLLTLAACRSSDHLAPTARLAYQASPVTLDTAKGMFQSTVTLRNTTSDPVPLRIGNCPVTFQFYRDTSRSGTPVFDSGLNLWCTDGLIVGELLPDSSMVFTGGVGRYTITDALGNAGTYYVTVSFESSQGLVNLDGGSIQLPISTQP